MLEIEFPTKRISRIYNVSKIKKTTATGYLYMIRPSYKDYLSTSERPFGFKKRPAAPRTYTQCDL